MRSSRVKTRGDGFLLVEQESVARLLLFHRTFDVVLKVREEPGRSIAFDDIAPHGIVLEQCWNAMGMDRQERVYIGFTSKRLDGREDFAVFRYDPSTGDRRFLGTFMDVAEAVGNLASREEIPKGHTRMLELDSKMYMGSQGFHDFKAAIDALPAYRGSHLYAYDISADTMEDVSRSLPGGVVTEHNGIIALSLVPGNRLHPRWRFFHRGARRHRDEGDRISKPAWHCERAASLGPSTRSSRRRSP